MPEPCPANTRYVAIQPVGQTAFAEVQIPLNGGGGGGGGTVSACDLNGDGVVNSQDVQIADNQALGLATCTGDLNGDGVCTIVDVQRVINAADGGSCRTGP